MNIKDLKFEIFGALLSLAICLLADILKAEDSKRSSIGFINEKTNYLLWNEYESNVFSGNIKPLLVYKQENFGAHLSSSCQVNDSLELVKFKSNFKNLNWDLNKPYKFWKGIKVNDQGCVTHIILNNAGLEGTLHDLTLSSLIELELIGNKISGTIPSFSNLAELKALWLSNNQLTGTIPDFKLKELMSIDLSGNKFSGNIPNFELENLTELGLSNNLLSGSLPLLKTPKLAWIRLDHNKLSGNFPQWTFQDLQGINLNVNEISGTFPELALNNLRQINLDSNKLEGRLKGNFPNLWELSISANRFSSISDLAASSLGRAILVDNQLTGNFNADIAKYPNLTSIQLQNNQWTFEPLLPLGNLLSQANTEYAPQKPTFKDSVILGEIGKNIVIDLKIDATVKDNVYSWNKDGKFYKSLTGINKLAFTSLQAADSGAYTVTVTNPTLKKLTISSKIFKIVIPCLPTNSQRSDTICKGQVMKFGNLNLTKEGTYSAVFKGANGCDSTVTLNLFIDSLKAVTMSYVENCKIFASVDISGGKIPFSYAWSNGQKTETASPLRSDSTYTVTVTDKRGCQVNATFKTPVFNELKITPTFKVPNCEKENGEIKLNLLGTKPFVINWGTNTKGQGDTLRVGLISGTYEVYVKDANNCLDTLELVLEKPTDCKLSYKVYTSFSPNEDGVNDMFIIEPLFCNSEELATCFPNNELIIFNRWSDVVFKSKPYNNTWDGKGLPEGTYYYLFKSDPESKKMEKGFITLIKRQ